MAFIKINPEQVDGVAKNLDERAEAVESIRKDIDLVSSQNHDPVESVVIATDFSMIPTIPLTPTYSSFTSNIGNTATFSGAAQGLQKLAEELRIRAQEARDLNSSGVTISENGVMSYYLPDPPEGTVDTEAYWNSMDTVSNVRAYNSKSMENGRAEAAELDEAIENGKSSKGRTVDEIMAEIAKHQDVPTYGLAFVLTWTPEEYLNLQNELDSEYTTVLAHNFAAATRNEANGRDLASMYDEATQGDETIEMMRKLNNLLVVPGTYYGTEFLVDLADRLEERPYDAIRFEDQIHHNSIPIPDPLAGVLTAMGNNPEAALTYLVPDGEMASDGYWDPGTKTQERWDRLRVLFMGVCSCR